MAKRRATKKPDPEVAVSIVSHDREGAVIRLARSILAHGVGRPARIYIADNGVRTEAKENLYAHLERVGHCVLRLEPGTMLGAARNAILDAMQGERFLLYLDDDYIWQRGGTVDPLIRTAEGLKYHLVAGAVRDMGIGCRPIGAFWEYNASAGTLRARRVFQPDRHYELSGVRFWTADFTCNFWVAPVELFRQVRWDSELGVNACHMDFFLQLKLKSSWHVAVVPSVTILHDPFGDDDYRAKRLDQSSRQVMMRKWNLRKISNFDGKVTVRM